MRWKREVGEVRGSGGSIGGGLGWIGGKEEAGKVRGRARTQGGGSGVGEGKR